MPKETLMLIHPDKRDRVVHEAACLFAERGFSRADMAELANRAKVAKGSLYNYFESKEDCYMFVCQDALDRYRQAVYDGLEQDWDIYRQVEHIFRSGAGFVLEHPEYIILYLNISSAGMDRFADQLSQKVEQQFARLLKELLTRDMTRGLVRADLDIAFAAHMLNSLYIFFLSSLVSRHHQIRLQEYLELDMKAENSPVEELLERTVKFLKTFLKPPEEENHG